MVLKQSGSLRKALLECGVKSAIICLLAPPRVKSLQTLKSKRMIKKKDLKCSAKNKAAIANTTKKS